MFSRAADAVNFADSHHTGLAEPGHGGATARQIPGATTVQRYGRVAAPASLNLRLNRLFDQLRELTGVQDVGAQGRSGVEIQRELSHGQK